MWLLAGRRAADATEATPHETLLVYFFGDTDRHYRRNFDFFTQHGLRGSAAARVYCLIIVQPKVMRPRRGNLWSGSEAPKTTLHPMCSRANLPCRSLRRLSVTLHVASQWRDV